MHILDWVVLIFTIGFIVVYGTLKTKRSKNIQDYLLGDNQLKWWQIGISVMATQASAVTFISIPGQAYESGMGFLQFYFGLPLAVIIISAFIIPIYYKLKVFTAYEYLENRFSLGVRQLTAFLFLIQRGLAAGITIYAPAILLSIVLNIDLQIMNIIIGILVIIYTVTGGSKAVNVTQQQQMAVMMIGLFVALGILLYKLSNHFDFQTAYETLKTNQKLNIVNYKFDWENRYTIWSGILGGTFLSLSYFGTDQSQVGRYLGGKSSTESRLGLLFNGLLKIPMQFFILLVGVCLFLFYINTKPPIHFNTTEYDKLKTNSVYTDSVSYFETIYHHSSISNQKDSIQIAKSGIKRLMLKNNDDAITKESDFVFVHFVMNYMPMGIIGLLFAVILCAAMSSTSSELNSLASTTLIDFYKRSWKKDKDEKHYLFMSKAITAGWGVVSIIFAMIFSLFDNLIEAVNIIGSLFYGTILGIFLAGFFFKRINSKAILIAALISEIIVLVFYYLNTLEKIKFSFLWLNPLGCLSVIFIGLVLSLVMSPKKEN